MNKKEFIKFFDEAEPGDLLIENYVGVIPFECNGTYCNGDKERYTYLVYSYAKPFYQWGDQPPKRKPLGRSIVLKEIGEDVFVPGPREIKWAFEDLCGRDIDYELKLIKKPK